MFTFIRSACASCKDSLYNAGLATVAAAKSAYTKFCNFFFGTPIESQKVAKAPESTPEATLGALSNFSDVVPAVNLQRSPKPTQATSNPVPSQNRKVVRSPFAKAVQEQERRSRSNPENKLVDTSTLPVVLLPLSLVTPSQSLPSIRKSSADIFSPQELKVIKEDGVASGLFFPPRPAIMDVPTPIVKEETPILETNPPLAVSFIESPVAFCGKLASQFEQALVEEDAPEKALNYLVQTTSSWLSSWAVQPSQYVDNLLTYQQPQPKNKSKPSF